MSAVVGKSAIMDAPTAGGLGGTYGGNALACAAALAVIDTFEQEPLLENGRERAAQLLQGLTALQQKYAFIGDVRGRGFMLAMEIVNDRADKHPDPERTQLILDECRKRGLLLIKCGIHRNTIRFLAPLVVTASEVDEALGVLGAVLADPGVRH